STTRTFFSVSKVLTLPYTFSSPCFNSPDRLFCEAFDEMSSTNDDPPLTRLTMPIKPFEVDTAIPSLRPSFSPLSMVKDSSHWSRALEITLALIVSRSEEHTSELQSRFDLVC